MADKYIDEIQKLFAEFKSADARNDEVAVTRLNDAINAVETKMNSRLDEIEKAANRPSVSEQKNLEIKSFNDFAAGRISEAEYKSVSGTGGTNGSEGGVTIPKVIDPALNAALVDISDFRSLVNVRSSATPEYHINFSPAGAASGWVGEKAARPETTAPLFTDIKVPTGEIYANLFATQQILNDSQFDMQSFIISSATTEFARAEGAAIVNGSGTNQPQGFLSTTLAATADATRAFGTSQYIASGAAAAMPTSADTLFDLVYSLKAGYRNGAAFACNKLTVAALRKYKDSTGQYLWQPSLVAGAPSTFLGYPIVEAEDMPNIGAGATPLVLANWKAFYTLVDIAGVNMLRDPFSAKPFVSFYMTKRLGGCVVDTAAAKFLKIAAS